MLPSPSDISCLPSRLMIPCLAYVLFYGCQKYDSQTSHSMTLLYRRFLTFPVFSYSKIFRTRTFFRCSTFLIHAIIIFMLTCLIRSLSVLLSRSFFHVSYGRYRRFGFEQESWFCESNPQTSSSWILHAYLTFDWMFVMIFFISVYVLCRCLIPALVVLFHMYLFPYAFITL